MLDFLSFSALGLALSLVTTVPLAWKWALGVRRVAAAVATLSVSTAVIIELAPFFDGAGAALSKAGANWVATLGAALALLAYRFYRDPDRTIPSDSHIIVSPADGEVLYVRESTGGMLPVSTKKGRHYTLEELTKTPLEMNAASVIGIGMSFLDVHVNRAPIAGSIRMTRYFAGGFGSLRLADMEFHNSRATTIIQQNDLQIAIVQIASRLVRQIVSFVAESQHVALGQRIGQIRFGSQVDLLLPLRPDLKVLVKPGDRVTAGSSIVAVLQK